MPAVHPNPARAHAYAVVASVVMVVVSPLAALSYFATADGAESLDVATARAWAEPARRLLEPLLSFASPDRVYATYTLILALVLPAMPVAAWTVRRARLTLAGTVERRSSWVVAAAWTLFSAGLAVVGVALQLDPSGTSGTSAVNLAFSVAVLPGLVVAVFGSGVLGVSWLRHGFRPRRAALLVTGALPLWIVGSILLGHNSIGLVPQVVAWTIACSRVVARTDSHARVSVS